MNFTEGEITRPLIKFAVPVFLALLLQSFYGAIDMLIVGRFAGSGDISAVSTGVEIMYIVTDIAGGLTMGVTVMLGHLIGAGKKEACGRAVGTGISLFVIMGIAFSVIMLFMAKPLSVLLNAPTEAFGATVDYVMICGGGSLVIFAYNLIGSIFRGIGDSKTPLMTVAIAAVFNILGDLVLVAGFNMGARGAAIATVGAQAISVIISYAIIRRRTLPFEIDRTCLKIEKQSAIELYKIGLPVALQGVMADLSFTIIMSFVNGLGVIASAGVGVASKLCGFVNLFTASFMQSLTTFVAQNFGAGRMDRAKLALRKGIMIAVSLSVFLFVAAFFFGDVLASIFTKDTAVIAAAADYVKAYAIDCIFTGFLFCFYGYFNGQGKTKFVMYLSLAGAFLIRVPFSYIMSRQTPVSLFMMGLAVPATTIVQIVVILIYFYFAERDKSVRIASPDL